VSRQTKQALDDALRVHVESEIGGGIIAGYVLQAAYINADTEENESTGYLVEHSDGQPAHACRGLAEQLADYYRDGGFGISITYGEDDEDD
jgi:hypothetical protein